MNCFALLFRGMHFLFRIILHQVAKPSRPFCRLIQLQPASDDGSIEECKKSMKFESIWFNPHFSRNSDKIGSVKYYTLKSSVLEKISSNQLTD